MERVLAKTKTIKRGNPLDTDTMVGAQASGQQYEKILSYMILVVLKALKSLPVVKKK